MSITALVRESLAHAIENGHAVDFPEPLQQILLAIAEHADGPPEPQGAGHGEPVAPIDVDAIVADLNAKLEAAVETINQLISERTEQLALQVERYIEERLKALAATPAPPQA